MCRRTCCPFFWGGIGILGSGSCCRCNNGCGCNNSCCNNSNSDSNSGCGCCNCCGN